MVMRHLLLTSCQAKESNPGGAPPHPPSGGFPPAAPGRSCPAIVPLQPRCRQSQRTLPSQGLRLHVQGQGASAGWRGPPRTVTSSEDGEVDMKQTLAPDRSGWQHLFEEISLGRRAELLKIDLL